MLVGPTSGKRSVFSRCEKAIALYCRAYTRFLPVGILRVSAGAPRLAVLAFLHRNNRPLKSFSIRKSSFFYACFEHACVMFWRSASLSTCQYRPLKSGLMATSSDFMALASAFDWQYISRYISRRSAAL